MFLEISEGGKFLCELFWFGVCLFEPQPKEFKGDEA